MAKSRLLIWNKGKDTISASAAKVVDSIPLTKFRSLKYMISFSNLAETQTKSLELTVRKESSDVNDTIYARFGRMDIAIDSQVNAGNFELLMTNSESFNVELKFLRAFL